MIDPELKYCPKCKDEYRAEIERCAECGIPLLSGAEILAAMKQVKGRRNGQITPGEELVAIHKADLNEMRAIERELKRENIGCLITGEGGGGCGKGCCGSGSSLYLQVRPQEARDAFAIIQAYLDRTSALDDHDLSHCDAVFDPQAAQAVCPACGFKFTTSTTTCPDCGLCFG